MPSSRSRAVALAALAAVASSLASAQADAAPAGPPPSAPREDEALSPEWRQTFMAPRVTGNLRAVAVDPTDAKNLYVGTEEGTLSHSTDGGVTWDEIELSPFLLQSPTVGLIAFDQGKSVDVFSGFSVYVPPYYYSANPLNRKSAGQGMVLAGPPIPPPFLTIFPTFNLGEPLLGAIAAADPRPYQELVRIRVCPGAELSVLVATRTRLYATADGANFVPIFSGRESAPVTDVVCSPTNPAEIVVATGDGTFRSGDSGSSFDLAGGGFGPAGSTALAYAPAEKDGKAQLVAATGRDLWIGDPGEPDGMKQVSLTGGASADIHSIAVTAQSMWLATESGARVSHDAGKTWESVDDLEGFSWDAVAVVSREKGREQVAVLREDVVFESTDGVVFRPFFRGQSRRRLRQIAASPDGFYLLTSGEVWTTADPRSPKAGDDAARRWAEQRLRRMPSLTDTLHRALLNARLTDAQIDEVSSGLKHRGWVPGVSLGGVIGAAGISSAQATSISNPVDQRLVTGKNLFFATVNLVWELPDLVTPSYNFTPVRRDLYELRKRYAYVVEDAYDERRQVLSQIASGGLDAEQLLTLQSRIEVLDVVIQQFTGEAQPR